MSGRISREEFARDLVASGLLGDEALRAAVGESEAEPGSGDGEAVARRLVDAGHLTAFQADAVLRRRFDALFIGNYVVLDRIGAGGMGTVYKARHRRMKRTVALKVLPREVVGRPSFAQRFQREVETIAQLSHPNIVMAFDADEAEAGPFLVMEFVDGRDLGAEVQLGGPLSVAEAVIGTLQAARGLEYAHGLGFIHRDVKPANLLRDARGMIKVADLGLARLKDAEPGEITAVTQAGIVVGTAEYMPPEQANDSSRVDGRSDLYALGCTLFYLLTGRAPYTATSLIGMLLRHREARVPSLREARPGVPDGLDAIFRRMVAKRPDDRYPTMTALIEALESIRPLTDPLTARPHGPAAPAGPPITAVTHTFDESTADDLDTTFVGRGLGRRGRGRLVGGPPGGGPDRHPGRAHAAPGADRPGVSPRPGDRERLRHRLRRRGPGAGPPGRADVLLSSMHLAEMTGAELARAVHAAPGLAGVGFVLASGDSVVERPAVERLGPTVFLAKPYDLRGLAQSLAWATGARPRRSCPDPDDRARMPRHGPKQTQYP